MSNLTRNLSTPRQMRDTLKTYFSERPKDEPYRISQLAECVPIKAHRQQTEKNRSHTFAPFTGLGRAGKVKERPLGL